MAIPELSEKLTRDQIGFVGDMPRKAQNVLKKRGYNCYDLEKEAQKHPTPILLKTTDSLVVTVTQENLDEIVNSLKPYAGILDHDCRLYIRYAANPRTRRFVLRAVEKLRLPPTGFDKGAAALFAADLLEGRDEPVFAPYAYILQARDNWDHLANLIMRNPAGPAPNLDLDITIFDSDHKPSRLSEEKNLLLMRAFEDCLSVKLFQKTNGLSGVDAFEAFAHGKDITGSPWPYRYFAKLGPRDKVAREFQKYRTTALQNIPYHLGPRLRMDRCVLGRSYGLIVSDYVSGAEALRDCVRDTRGIPAIGNLFNQTLIAWRRAATKENRRLQDVLMQFLPKEIPKHRKSLIESYGATQSLEELKQLIENTPSSMPVLTGVIHGDLHATNVLVRMGDAVIIDLERIGEKMPLLYDAASLEGGLFVDGFISDRRPAEEVMKSIGPLYTKNALDHSDKDFNRYDHHCHPTDGSAWFMDCVRQIRMQARQMELMPRQYGLTLAAVLLKKACNTEDFREESRSEDPGTTPLTREALRALAYVLAEQILNHLSK